MSRQDVPGKRGMPAIRIIGMGNAFAGDDAIGLQVVRVLQEQEMPTDVDIMEITHVGVDLLDLMEGVETVVLIDAVKSGKPAGTIHHIEGPEEWDRLIQIAGSSQTSSTHAFGLGEVLALGQTLDRLPPTLILYGIELDHTGLGSTLSQQVAQAGKNVSARLAKSIAKCS